MFHNLHRRYFGGYLLMEEEETGLLYTHSLNNDMDFTQLLWFQFHNYCFLDGHRRHLYGFRLGEFTSPSQQVINFPSQNI